VQQIADGVLPRAGDRGGRLGAERRIHERYALLL
jgi:hypothetical protein